MSVATKLKKFHTVMQECGGVKLGLQVGGCAYWLADCPSQDTALSLSCLRAISPSLSMSRRTCLNQLDKPWQT